MTTAYDISTIKRHSYVASFGSTVIAPLAAAPRIETARKTVESIIYENGGNEAVASHLVQDGATITLEEYIHGCFYQGFANMCREKYSFTEQELVDEYTGWKAHIRTHIPDPYPGIERIIRKQKEEEIPSAFR